MGQHHRREDQLVTAASALPRPPRTAPPTVVAPRHLVPQDAPPAGLGYPPPTSYRPHPVTGVPTPPRMVRLPVPASPTSARLRHRAPLAVAVLGAAVAVVGGVAQVPSLTAGLAAGGAAGGAGTSSSEVEATPAAGTSTARQCASVVADALDTTVTDLGRTGASQWASVVEDRESGLAATYGTGSPEYRAYVEGVDDIVGWLRDTTPEDYGVVTTRVARGVAATCGYTG